MHVHFLGICGTFMAGLALLAREPPQGRPAGRPYPTLDE